MKWVQRFHCRSCGRHFSRATSDECFKQKRRDLNPKIEQNLASGMSIRRIAMILKCSKNTVQNKLIFLGLQARHFNFVARQKLHQISELQFDDMETFEHTKMKPLSLTLAVEKHSRIILGIETSRMPAKGLLAKRALKKYGFRKDERSEGRDRLFRKIKSKIEEKCVIESDQNPHYPLSLKEHFPKSLHIPWPGARGCVVGQGELKALAFDPLFSLNHTAAMFRANVNRLFRKTWCTTKKIENLTHHLEIYVKFHNEKLLAF